jgi:hypothetical protein
LPAADQAFQMRQVGLDLRLQARAFFHLVQFSYLWRRLAGDL